MGEDNLKKKNEFVSDDNGWDVEELTKEETVAENRQALTDDVIEMQQEDGVPVETKAATPKAGEKSAPKTTEKPVTAKRPEHVSEGRSRKAFYGVVAVALAVILIGGSLMAGAFMQRREDAEGSLGGDGTLTTEELIAGGGGGKPVEKVVPVAQDDKLTLELLKLHNTEENSCYSPLSIRYALEMLREGAEGETKTQIDNLLGNITAMRYENIDGHMSLANSLWMQTAWQDKIKPEYQKDLKQKFGAEVKVDDFRSAANINGWIETNTLGMMKDALTNEDVEGLNAALVNVLAIDMNWQTQYDELSTFGGFFNFDKLDVDKDTDVDQDQYKYTTMQRYGGEDVYYNLSADATVLAQDLKEYNGTRLQFVAMMPEDLPSFVQKVNNNDINRLLGGLRRAVPQNDTYEFSFTAYIPKFGIEGGIADLIEDLRELGVVDAFEVEKAKLTKITDEPFAIDAATHKTKFDFTEEGIRAAAVTIAGGKGAAGGPGPIPSSVRIVVSINKPFMYLVRDVKTGEIWFAGTVYDPNHWADDKAMYQGH